jgi:hypothetical protein
VILTKKNLVATTCGIVINCATLLHLIVDDMQQQQPHVLQWSPCICDRFVQCYDNKIKLYEFDEQRQPKELASKYVHAGNCISWSGHESSKNLMLYGTQSGSVGVVDWGRDGEDDLVNISAKYGTRPCTGVSWNPQMRGLVAASFDKVRSEYCAIVWDIEHARDTGEGADAPGHTPNRMPGPGGDRDSAAVTQTGLSAVYRASYQEAASCVQWMPMERQLLAVGTAIGYVRLFDMNVSKKNDVGSVQAYKSKTSARSRGVTIRPSPFDSNLLATFTDTAGDPVKIWDVRKMDTSFRLAQSAAIVATDEGNSNKCVSEVQWSPTRRGVLAVSSVDSPRIEFFDASLGMDNANGDRTADEAGYELTVVSSPIFHMDATDAVRSISWDAGQYKVRLQSENSNNNGGDEDNSNDFDVSKGDGQIQLPFMTKSKTTLDPWPRLLVSLASDKVLDVSVVESLPVAVGRDELAYENRELCIVPLNVTADTADDGGISPRSPSAMARTAMAMTSVSISNPNPIVNDNFVDVDRLMKRRAVSGYSLDVSKNARVLSRELDDLPMAYATSHPQLAVYFARTSALLHVWDWLNRVETLADTRPKLVTSAISDATSTSLRVNAAKAEQEGRPSGQSTFSVETCGIRKLVGMRASIVRKMSALCSTVYESDRRSLARVLCGWCQSLEYSQRGSDHHGDGTGDNEGDRDDDVSSGTNQSSCSEDENDNHNSDESDGDSSSDEESVKSGDKRTNDNSSVSDEGNDIDADADGSNDVVDEDNLADGEGVGAGIESKQRIRPFDTRDEEWRKPTDFGPLVDAVDESELIDSFERAAALAVFHGNPGLAVRVLQRNVAEKRRAMLGSGNGHGHPSSGAASAGVGSPGIKDERRSSRSFIMNEGFTAQLGITTDVDAIAAEEHMSEDYLQVVSLVAMSIAGFISIARREGREKKSRRRSDSEMWESMTREAVRQLKHFSRPASCYLSAMCNFLLCNLGAPLGRMPVGRKKTVPTQASIQATYHAIILDDHRLALEDRVGFACTFLSDEEVTRYLQGLEGQCVREGAVEGLLVAGLGSEGLSLLGKYVDRYDDLQTAALLVARLDAARATSLSAATDVGGGQRAWIWLHEYRHLLNRWQLFIERATLDVALGHRFRQAGPLVRPIGANTSGSDTDRNKSTSGSVPSQGPLSRSGPAARPGGRAPAGGPDRRSAADRTLWTLPPHSPGAHIFLRCHYCQSSLPVDCMDKSNQSAWLRRQRPVISCCPGCKKPLPRCYVCLLYMGLFNPQLEYNRVARVRALEATRKAQEEKQIQNEAQNQSDVANSNPTSQNKGNEREHIDTLKRDKDRDREEEPHNVLDFGRWFTWCQHCRHGGHAVCLNDWFGDHGSCGVNGCDCRCKSIS